MNGVQTRLKCKPNVKRCKRFVFAAHSPLLHPNTLKTKAIIHFQTDHILTRFVFPPLLDFYRPTDVVNLWGNPAKAKRELGWNPQKTTFEQLVKIMVDADMAKVAVERAGEHVRTNLEEYLEKGIVK